MRPRALPGLYRVRFATAVSDTAWCQAFIGRVCAGCSTASRMASGWSCASEMLTELCDRLASPHASSAFSARGLLSNWHEAGTFALDRLRCLTLPAPTAAADGGGPTTIRRR